MATHLSILAWKIPWREEPGGRSPQGHRGSNTAEQLRVHTRFILPTSQSKHYYYPTLQCISFPTLQ